jgi:hypothetical protein
MFALINSNRVLEHAPNLYQRTVHLTFAMRYHFPMNLNRAIRPGKILCGARASNPLHLIHERTAAPAGHRWCLADRTFLIETPPRIEIAITHSFKRRKHFLIETRNSFWGASSFTRFPATIAQACTHQENQGGELEPFPQYPYVAAMLSLNIALNPWRIA